MTPGYSSALVKWDSDMTGYNPGYVWVDVMDQIQSVFTTKTSRFVLILQLWYETLVSLCLFKKFFKEKHFKKLILLLLEKKRSRKIKNLHHVHTCIMLSVLFSQLILAQEICDHILVWCYRVDWADGEVTGTFEFRWDFHHNIVLLDMDLGEE